MCRREWLLRLIPRAHPSIYVPGNHCPGIAVPVVRDIRIGILVDKRDRQLHTRGYDTAGVSTGTVVIGKILL